MFTKTILLFLSTLGLCHQIFYAVKFVTECYEILAECPSFTTDVIDINPYNKINSASAQAAASLPFHLLLHRPHISTFHSNPGSASVSLPLFALRHFPFCRHTSKFHPSLYMFELTTFANSLIRYTKQHFFKNTVGEHFPQNFCFSKW